MCDLGAIHAGKSAAEFGAFPKAEIVRMGKIIRDTGAQES